MRSSSIALIGLALAILSPGTLAQADTVERNGREYRIMSHDALHREIAFTPAEAFGNWFGLRNHQPSVLEGEYVVTLLSVHFSCVEGGVCGNAERLPYENGTLDSTMMHPPRGFTVWSGILAQYRQGSAAERFFQTPCERGKPTRVGYVFGRVVRGHEASEADYAIEVDFVENGRCMSYWSTSLVSGLILGLENGLQDLALRGGR